MYYAFKISHTLPPGRDIHGFERPRGKLYAFDTIEKRSKFVESTKHVVRVSKKEINWLLGSDR